MKIGLSLDGFLAGSCGVLAQNEGDFGLGRVFSMMAWHFSSS